VTSQFTAADGWQRLHPLSPLLRIGRVIPVIALGLVLSAVHSSGSSGGGSGETYYVVGIAVLSTILGFVHWLVTRWKIEGDTLRIETGLIRRDSRRLPLARIQAVDIVRPLLARLLGISELRIRLAGSGSTDGRLAYLPEQAALVLRERLMSGVVDPAARPPETVERHMAAVPTGRLVGSVLLSGLSIVLFGIIVALLLLADLAPKAAAGVFGFAAIYLFSFVTVLWRRLSNEFHFEAVETADGVRIRRGLLSTVSETVPFGRIQAVRQIEPLLWRPLGWCRLEVDIAGAGARKQRGEGSGVTRKALLPVGSQQEAWHLVDRLIGNSAPVMTPPPARARRKAPLSYHFLSAGHDARSAICVTGRVRKVTAWVPLEKAQSIRRVQGPVQRRFGLATVHVDAAGKDTRAEFRDRSVEEADQLVEELTELTRAARSRGEHKPSQAVGSDAVAVPPGWYPDPSGRHQLRYWSGETWTHHVSDDGATTTDPVKR
jgi:putative membrane protein